MIDAHAHLQDKAFEPDLKDVLLRAKHADVNSVVCASVDFKDSVNCLNLSRTFDMVLPCAGLAPYSELSEIGSVLKMIEDSPDIVAVGEIGLDYKEHKNPAQAEPFRKQVALAMELDLPVVIHSRSAGKYCLEILDGMKAERVVMHAFDGSLRDAKKGFDKGYFFTIPANVIKNPQKQELAREVPEELMLLETDSPVLSPFEGRNEPANLVHSRDFIARLKNIEPHAVGTLSEVNARKAFRI